MGSGPEFRIIHAFWFLFCQPFTKIFLHRDRGDNGNRRKGERTTHLIAL
jgi:hypothetical protein